MIRYPSELPPFVRTGYEIQGASPMIRTEMSNGKAKQRRRYKSVPTYIMATTAPMTSWQAVIFESWWHEVLVGGSEWFEAPISTPLGYEMRVMRFTDVYSGPTMSGICGWQFRFSLELLKAPILPGGWMNGAPDFISNINQFDVLMNQTWPLA